MTRAIALAQIPIARLQEEFLRKAVVIGSALALIAAGSASPF